MNLIRQAVPALRKGQYSREGCNGSFAFKRRYTNGSTDSFALVCINGGATFSGIPNGTYTDCVTGDVKNVTNGTLSASCSGRGNMRVYVLNGPGKIGEDGKYMFASSAKNIPDPTWDGTEEEKATSGGTCEKIVSPVVTMSPASGANVGVNGKVTLTASRGTIYYTTDGSTPSASSTKYTSPITISVNKTVIKAIAIDGTETSSVATGTYYTHEMPVVTLNPTGGYVGQGGKVTLSSNVENASIYYTLDGSDPTTSSTKYTSPVAITQNQTILKAVAEYQGDLSEIVTGKFLTEKPAGITIEFTAPSNWGNCNFYAWNDNGDEFLGAWPGKAAEKDGVTGRYTMTIDVDDSKRPINIIFNNGSEQSANIMYLTEDEYCYDATGMSGKFTPRACGEQPSDNSIQIGLKKSNFYASTTPNIHYWNNGTSGTNWPGEQMKSQDENWWYYNVPTSNGVCNIIFNGNGVQTGNIENISSKTCYEISADGKGYTVVDCSGLVNADEAQANETKIEAYPNPTTGWVTVETDKEISSIKALSTSGAAVAGSNGAEINLSGAAAGLYLLGIQFEDGTVGFTKVIKK